MKIVVTKDAEIAGSPWKKGTLLECPKKAAEQAIKDGVAEGGEAVDKAEKAAAKAAAAEANKKAKSQSTDK